MRIALSAVEVLNAEGSRPIQCQVALLERAANGRWRLLLHGLNAEGMVILQDLFASAEVARFAFTTEEGDRSAGLAKVARLSLGNTNSAVLEGIAPLP